MKSLLILCCFSVLTFAQATNNNYVDSPVLDGLPSSIPMGWDNCVHAEINCGTFYKNIFIISRDSLHTINQAALAFTDEIGFSFFNLDFSEIKTGVFKTTVYLKSISEDDLAPLEIIVDIKNKSIRYRWNNMNGISFDTPTIVKEYPYKAGKEFPDIDVNTISGQWSNKNLNKILVLNWWATSCIPCIEEIPDLNKLVKVYENDNVEFLSILFDKENYQDFMQEHKFDYIQGFGDDNLTELLGNTFPRHIIVNSDGIILLNKTGAGLNTYSELQSIISDNL